MVAHGLYCNKQKHLQWCQQKVNIQNDCRKSLKIWHKELIATPILHKLTPWLVPQISPLCWWACMPPAQSKPNFVRHAPGSLSGGFRLRKNQICCHMLDPTRVNMPHHRRWHILGTNSNYQLLCSIMGTGKQTRSQGVTFHCAKYRNPKRRVRWAFRQKPTSQGSWYIFWPPKKL